MAKIVKPLSPLQVKNAKTKGKLYKLADGGGLYLEVTPTGSKLWRMKFRQANGKENRLSFGTYPTVSLEEARQKRLDAKKMLTAGTDPAQAKKTAKRLSAQAAANTFEAVGREWFEKFSSEWAETHSSKIQQRLEKDIYPVIGRRPIDEITAPELLDALKKIEARGAVETAHRVRSHCGQIFRYAIVTGRAQRDVSQDDSLARTDGFIKKGRSRSETMRMLQYLGKVANQYENDSEHMTAMERRKALKHLAEKVITFCEEEGIVNADYNTSRWVLHNLTRAAGEYKKFVDTGGKDEDI